MYPILLNKLFSNPNISFGWTVRAGVFSVFLCADRGCMSAAGPSHWELTLPPWDQLDSLHWDSYSSDVSPSILAFHLAKLDL